MIVFLVSLDFTLVSHIIMIHSFLLKGGEPSVCDELLSTERIIVLFLFWSDWSEGAAFYISVSESTVRGCLLGLHFDYLKIFDYLKEIHISGRLQFC